MSNENSKPASSNELFADALKNKPTEDASKEAPKKEESKTEAKETKEVKKAEASQAEDSGSEADDDDAQNGTQAMPSELDMLKQRARLMNISFSNNIGVDALREKINAKLTGEGENASLLSSGSKNPEESQETMGAKEKVQPKGKTPSLRQMLFQREMKLVRVRITNLDPKKKDLPGEIFTVANEYLGAVKKFIPYGEATDNGYHIPYCIYKQLRDRKFVSIKTRKGPRGQTIVESQMAREFALEVLPPLTEVELARLAAAQASRGDE